MILLFLALSLLPLPALLPLLPLPALLPCSGP